jgi:hypothetical protein
LKPELRDVICNVSTIAERQTLAGSEDLQAVIAQSLLKLFITPSIGLAPL